MKLHEIIGVHDTPDASINLDYIEPYKRLLHVYYKDKYSSWPCLMVTHVFNGVGLGRIVPGNCLLEVIDDFLETWGVPEEDKPHAREEIIYNSIPLAEF